MNLAALRGVGGVFCAVVAAGVLALPHYSTDLWPALVLLFIGLGILGMPIVEQVVGLAGGAAAASRQTSPSPHLLEEAMRGLPQAVIVLNDEKVVLWNAAAERLFGWSAQETAGRPLPFALGGEAVPPDVAEAAARPRTKAGAPIDSAVVSSLLRDSQGRVTGRMLVFAGPAGPARPEDRDPFQAALLELPTSIGVAASSATNISMVQEIRNRLQIQSHVASVSRALSRLAPSAEVMKTIGEAALSLGKADRAAVYLRQPDGAVSCPWSRGPSESYVAQAQRAADLEVFFDLSKRLRVARNPEAIYPILVGQAMNLTRAEKGMLFLLEPKGAAMACVYMAGLPPEARGEAFPTSGSAFGKVAETGTPYRTDNLGGEPLPVWLNVYRSIGPAAIVPVRSESEIIGTLALGDRK